MTDKEIVSECKRRWPSFKLEFLDVNGERCLSATMTEGGKPYELTITVPTGERGPAIARSHLIEGLRATLREGLR